MPKALRLNVNGRLVPLSPDDIADLARELRALDREAFPAAILTAAALEAGAADEIAAGRDDLRDDEEAALAAALDSIEIARGLARLSPGLVALRDALRQRY